MNPYHLEILKELKKAAKKLPADVHFDPNRYFGTKKPYLYMKIGKAIEICKNWKAKHPDITFKEFVGLLDSMFQGKTFNERTFGGKLLEYFPKLRNQIDPGHIDKWLTGAEGWAEVDSLCQSNFSSEIMLKNWPKWKKLLNKLVNDKDIQKKRASLVLLSKPVGHSDDKRLSEMAFKNIDKLKSEKNVLITKAISWLLRGLINFHRKEVEVYLNRNEKSLPKIALRETWNKLKTGKKKKADK